MLCINCAHEKKEHGKGGCSLSEGMEDFPGSKPSKHDVVTMTYLCECKKFVLDDGIYIDLHESQRDWFIETKRQYWDGNGHTNGIYDQIYAHLLGLDE